MQLKVDFKADDVKMAVRIYFHLFSSFSAAQALKCLGFIIYHPSIVATIPGMYLRYGCFLTILTV